MKVLVLAGGDSSEREVSLNSGRAMFDAVKELGHEVLAIDPSDGRSLVGANGAYTAPAASGVRDAESKLTVFGAMLQSPEVRAVDVALLALHGGSGENGVIQCLLDMAGIPYTGSGMRASAIAMDKAITKRLVMTEGIPTPPWRLYRVDRDGVTDDVLSEIQTAFELPMIVKSNDGGSTVGLTKVERWEDLGDAMKRAAAESPGVLVERFIAGRELTVSLLDGESLPVVEIKPKAGLYDYEAKYTKGGSEYFAPADIQEELAAALQLAAEDVYGVIGAAGLVRVDFMLDESGDYYLLELNTLPGMTTLSLAPMAAGAVGIDFNHLVERILRSALKDIA